MFSPSIVALVDALRALPGIGQKSAQRMALFLLDKEPTKARCLGEQILDTLKVVCRCRTCRTLCESAQCGICTDLKRDSTLLCIVETPMDIVAIEQSSSFRGRYFVLMGHLSPLDGIGPKELKLDELQDRLMHSDIEEVVLAVNPTIEGEATSHYLTQLCQACQKRVSKIAHGVPFGGELEYVDAHTLSHAFSTRQVVG